MKVFGKKTTKEKEKATVLIAHDRIESVYNLSEDQVTCLLKHGYHPQRDCANDAALIVKILLSPKSSAESAYNRTQTALIMDLKEPSMENLSILSSLANVNISDKNQEKIINNWSKLFCNCKTVDSMIKVLKYIAKEFN